ncbi:hypothetical protein [Chryseobacterium sp. A301]
MDTLFMIFIGLGLIIYAWGFIALDWKDRNATLWLIAIIALPVMGSLAYLSYKQRRKYHKS